MSERYLGKNGSIEIIDMMLMTPSAKDAKIARLERKNEEYHFVCNMATEGGMLIVRLSQFRDADTRAGKQMEFEIRYMCSRY